MTSFSVFFPSTTMPSERVCAPRIVKAPVEQSLTCDRCLGDFLIRVQFLCSFLILGIFHSLVIVILVSTPNVVKAQSFDFSRNTAQLSPAVWVNIVTLQFPWGIWWSFSSPLNLGRAVLQNPGFLQGSQLQFPISCVPDHTSCH